MAERKGFEPLSTFLHYTIFSPLLALGSVVFGMAGLGRFELPECQSQSLVPYRLATAQYIILSMG